MLGTRNHVHAVVSIDGDVSAQEPFTSRRKSAREAPAHGGAFRVAAMRCTEP